MSKKQKKDKKNLKSLQLVSAEQLLDQARALLENEKARDAIDILKWVEKNFETSDMLRLLLFRAYLMREGQLRSKGMHPEADIVRKHALAAFPPLERLTEADVTAYLSHACLEEAFHFYMRLAKDHPLAVLAERLLVYRLMASDDWRVLETLAPDHPLRQDANVVRKALDSMNAGNWETALQELRPVARRSPYAALRLFCKAMVLFYEEKDAELLHTIARIPPDFPLNPILQDIRSRIEGINCPVMQTATALPSSPGAIFWEDSVIADRLANGILQILQQSDIRPLSAYLMHFARTVCPADPSFAILYLLELMMAARELSLSDIRELYPMIKSLVSRSDIDLLEAKTQIANSLNIQSAIASYGNVLEKCVPDSERRALIRSMILLFAAKTAHQRITFAREAHHQFPFRFMKRSMDWSHQNELLMDVVWQSIESDPLHREAYTFLLTLPHHTKEAKKTVEKALSTMCDAFPDDPYPCLELSKLYYEKNAFRKAETVLDEAARRAPHDRRVIERKALSYLIAACKNFNRSNADLVLADLDKAESVGCKAVQPLVFEKRILFHLLKQPEQIGNLTIENVPETLSDINRIRVMGLLLQEVMDRSHMFTQKSIQTFRDHLGKTIRQAQLSSDAVVELLRPYPKAYDPVLPHKPIAYPLLCAHSKMWETFSNEQLIDTFLSIFHPDIIEFLAVELQKRIRRKKDMANLKMRFLLITIGYMKPLTIDAKEGFCDILEVADTTEKKELERISRRLGAHTNGLLQKCLMNFDFEPLEISFLRTIISSLINEDRDAVEDQDEDVFEEFAGDMVGNLARAIPLLKQHANRMTRVDRKEFQEICDAFIEELGLTGKPYPVILAERRKLRANTIMCRLLDDLAEIIRIGNISNLSREANTLIFGTELNIEQLKLAF